MKTDKETLALELNRVKRLAENPKDIKCPGALKKARRHVRNLQKKIEAAEA